MQNCKMRLFVRDLSGKLLAGVAACFLAAGIATAPASSQDLGLSKEIIAKAKEEGEVNLYSSSRRPTLDGIAKMFTDAYGIEVNVTRKSTGNIVQQVEIERRIGRISADVVQVGNEGAMRNWLEEGFFAGYKPIAAKYVPKEYQLEGGKLLSPYVNLQAPCYNTNVFKAADVPKTYEDFLKREFKGKLIVVDPHFAGPGPAIVKFLLENYDWGFVEKLAKQEPHVVRGVTTLTKMVANGEAGIGLQCNTSQAAALKAEGNPIDHVWIENGVPTVFTTAAVVKDAPHPNAARLFMEFMMSKPSVQVHADGGYKVSRPDVKDGIGDVPVPVKVPDWSWLQKSENAKSMNDKYMQILEKK